MSTDSLTSNKDECTNSTDTDSSSESTQKLVKHVSFLGRAFVILIPTANEYHEAGLGQHVWWSEEDFQHFKLSALMELREFCKKHPTKDCEEVLRMYYREMIEEEQEERGQLLQCATSSCDDSSEKDQKVKYSQSKFVEKDAETIIPVIESLVSISSCQEIPSDSPKKEELDAPPTMQSPDLMESTINERLFLFSLTPSD